MYRFLFPFACAVIMLFSAVTMVVWDDSERTQTRIVANHGTSNVCLKIGKVCRY